MTRDIFDELADHTAPPPPPDLGRQIGQRLNAEITRQHWLDLFGVALPAAALHLLPAVWRLLSMTIFGNDPPLKPKQTMPPE